MFTAFSIQSVTFAFMKLSPVFRNATPYEDEIFRKII